MDARTAQVTLDPDPGHIMRSSAAKGAAAGARGAHAGGQLGVEKQKGGPRRDRQWTSAEKVVVPPPGKQQQPPNKRTAFQAHAAPAARALLPSHPRPRMRPSCTPGQAGARGGDSRRRARCRTSLVKTRRLPRPGRAQTASPACVLAHARMQQQAPARERRRAGRIPRRSAAEQATGPGKCMRAGLPHQT